MAKISEYPSAETLDGSELIPAVQKGTTVVVTAGDIAALATPTDAAYTVYSASLSQTGTNAPVATVLENTTGLEWAWNYAGTGTYYVMADDDAYLSYPQNVMITISQTTQRGDGFVSCSFTGADNEIDVYTRDISSMTFANDHMRYTLFEIRIYS